jgi:replicative DNA helicase
MNIEKLIFENVLWNEDYNRKVIPFLKEEYFSEKKDQVVYNTINDYFLKYNRFPDTEALKIELTALKTLGQQEYKDTFAYIESFEEAKRDLIWLLDKTEEFVKDKALYNALMQAIKIVNEEKDSRYSKGAIPKILSDALGVSFDSSVGHNFLEDADERFEYYQRKIKKIPYDIDLLNTITDGGLPSKTLNVDVAGTGIGKTIKMCHQAGYNLMCGYNVLYITLEMAEEEISRRIDANLLDIPIADLKYISKSIYDKKMEKLRDTVKGKLVVKEYPTSCAGVNNFRYLLNELKLKQDFKPDILYVDYINLCASSRMKLGASINTYTYIKAIAEELRGLAVEYDFPVQTATQVNRVGFTDSDFGLEHTSESFGLPATADFMIAMISTEELEHLGQLMIKQLGKNRYAPSDIHKRFVIGIDKIKMRLYNVEQAAQENLVDDTNVVFDKTSFGEPVSISGQKFDKKMFESFL